MSVAKPAELPEWADGTGGAGIIDPPSAKKSAGWSVGDKPPAQYLNWFWNLLYRWIQYLNALTGQANTWSDTQTITSATGFGVSATGGGSNAGGFFTGGSGGGSGVAGQGVGAAPGVAATGGAAGSGGLFNGGASGGNGLSATANGGNGNGVVATGNGTGAGVSATGGATGIGVTAAGGGAAAGGKFTGGGGVSGGVGGDAIDLVSGPGAYGMNVTLTAHGGAYGPHLVLGPIAITPTVGVVEGSVYYDSALHALRIFTSTGWKTVTAS